ncbi:MAG: hypothetical protein NTW86_10115 [Candidatus Sumerlaeota bacterium]|nr:hypothetical protein [Candidatus Sumerlaeota bacterium]
MALRNSDRVCVLLLGVFLPLAHGQPALVTATPASPPLAEAEPSASARPAPLNGAQAMVRVYPDVLNDPSAYMGFQATVCDDGFTIGASDLPTSMTAFVVMVGTEQHDPNLAREVGASLQSWRYSDGPRFHLRRGVQAVIQPVTDGSGKIVRGLSFPERAFKTITIPVSDALGNPLNGALVTLTLSPSSLAGRAAGVRLKPVTVEKGQASFPEPAGVLVEASIRVEHPDFGAAEWDDYAILFGAADPEGPDPRPIVAPLARQGTPERARALNGVVVDPDGRPVANARLSCQVVRTRDEGLYNASAKEDRFHVPTDEAGRFSLYMPVKFWTRKPRQPIPSRSTYSVQVEPPLGSGLLAREGAFSNNEDAVIALERIADAHFHTFAFFDAAGPITDLERLRLIHMRGEAKGVGGAFEMDFLTRLNGGAIPAGTYTAELWENGEDLRFQPVEVTLDSPRELVFRPLAQNAYEGQVLDAVSGGPAGGAFVLVADALTSDGKVSDFTPADWALLHDLPAAPALDDKRLEPLKRICMIGAIQRTDGQGRFRVANRPGHTVLRFLVFDQDCLAVERESFDLKPSANGVIAISPIRLFPAAKANVEVLRANGRGWFYANWTIDKRTAPDWAKPLWDWPHPEWRFNDEWKGYGGDKSGWVSVPAEVPFGLRLECSPLDPVMLDGPFLLRKGERRDLGTHTPPAPVAVVIRVLDPRGQPAAGFPVSRLRQVRENEALWEGRYVTDAQGEVRFPVGPHSQGWFGCMIHLHAPNADGQRDIEEKIPYEVAGPEDAGKRFVLQVTDSLIQDVLGK